MFQSLNGDCEPAAEEQQAPPETSCPYLKEPKAAKHQSRGSCGLEGDVCGNLARLQKARKLYRKGEHFRRAGNAARAEACYEKVRHLTPGSRFDQLAEKRLAQLHAEAKPVAAAEEQEVHRPDPSAGCSPFTCPYLQKEDARKHQSASSATVGSALENLEKIEQARKLYRRAEKARRQGKDRQAGRLYEKTKAACPGSRYERLAEKRLTQMQAATDTESDSEGQELVPPPKPAEPTPPPEIESSLVPSLPPVDPRLVDALEQVLAAAGGATGPRLVIQVDDGDVGLLQPDDPVSQWPLVPFDATVPSGLLEKAENPEDLDDPDPSPAPSAGDMDRVLRDVLENLHAGTYIEIDPARMGTERPFGQIQLGPVLVSVVADDMVGWRCFLVGLKSAPASDVRAGQRRHNERILEWIDSLNGDLQGPQGTWGDEPLVEDSGSEDS